MGLDEFWDKLTYGFIYSIIACFNLFNMSSITIALIGGIGAMLGWGVSEVFVKKSMDKANHFQVLLFVQLLMFIFTWAFLPSEMKLPELSLTIVFELFIFGMLDLVAYISMYKAYSMNNVSVVAPITSSYAIVSAVVSYFFFDEPFSLAKVAVIILIMIGIILASFNFKDLKDGLDKKDLMRGMPYVILTFCIYGFYVPFWDRVIDGDGWVFISQITRFFTLIGAIVVVFYMQKGNNLFVKDKATNILLLFASIFLALGNGFFNIGLSKSEHTSITTAIGSSFLVVLIILAYLWLKERIAPNQYVGIVLIVVGIIVTSFI